MKALMASIAAAIILASVSSLPAQAAQNATITITMTGLHEISVNLSQTEWALGDVGFDTVRQTQPPIEWCTMTVQGTCNVKTFIVGADAEQVDNPDYKWTLSNDGKNGEHIYALWFRISGDTSRGHVTISKSPGEFWPPAGGSSMTPGQQKQFGLKLLTPTYFYSGRQMRTRIIISAVAA